MSAETHSQLANFIWSICNLLRGPYKRNEYRKVILPLTVLRRFDCLLAPTKEKVLKEYPSLKGKPETIVLGKLRRITGRPFYNLSKLDFAKLLNDPNQLAPNLNKYITSFSPNVRDIMDRFAFDQQIARMAEKNLLFEVIKAFGKIDLSPERVDNVQMGYVFEELIRIGAEQSNEEAGEHFTPREVIKLMVNLLLSPEKDLRRSHVVKTIYDPACGTGGMLSVAEKYIRDLNAEANPHLFGQDWNDEAWAVCKSDMLIKGEDADNIRLGDSFSQDNFDRDKDGKKITFDYMLANPPFGVEWKQQANFIEKEHKTLGYQGRFGAGLPRINDGSLLFLQHMLSKMIPANPAKNAGSIEKGGSRIGIVFNGSPLFTGDAGSGESNIRQWIIENDWLEAVVALPDQLFYNTGISTYIWILTNRKEAERKGKIQLIDARQFYVKMRKSLGNKRNKIGDRDEGETSASSVESPDQIGEIAKIHGNFRDGETRAFTIDGQQKTLVVSKIFDNADFGFHKITVERPLRLNFQASAERIARIEEESAFKNLAASNKKNEKVRLQEIAEGKKRQEEIRTLLRSLGEAGGQRLYKDRKDFLTDLRKLDHERNVRLTAPELKAVLNALGERDETAQICRDKDGNPEPDPELRDTETVPLKENVEDYFKREVLPHVPDLPAPRPRPGQFCIYVLKCADDSFYIGQTDNFERWLSEHRSGQASWTAPRLPVEPIHWEIFESRELAVKREKELKTGFGRKWLKREYDAGRLAAAARQAGAWIDHSKTKVGYEIPLNRHFYRYEPPRPLEEIEADIKTLESEILALLKEVAA
jgi:type I restriction enzyme M protein